MHIEFLGDSYDSYDMSYLLGSYLIRFLLSEFFKSYSVPNVETSYSEKKFVFFDFLTDDRTASGHTYVIEGTD